MAAVKNVAEYIDKHKDKAPSLLRLRDVMLSCGLEEVVKWGAPVYMHKGENIIGLAAFKSYVGIWFFQGVFLSDPDKVLVNASEGKTKALRQWRFENEAELDEGKIRPYVLEAIQNQEAGKKLKAQARKVAIPEELTAAMEADADLKQKFQSLSPGKRKDYCEHIGGAKREETRMSRLEKAVPLILAGVGLHDKYKNC
jgi:uncharacterized protein YdeI (YjbR/CyaY-like superfamily)